MMDVDSGSKGNIVELLYERAQRHPDRLALAFTSDGETVECRLTYAEVHARAAALAAALRPLAPVGERALLLYTTGPGYVIGLLGCLYSGLVAVPAYPPAGRQPSQLARLAAIVRDSRPSLVLTEASLVAQLDAVRGAMPELAGTRIVGTDALERGTPDPAPPDLKAGQLALLQYTSGSTARPKGVMLSHANLMANERAIETAFGMNAEDVVVSWLPLFHDMGMIGTLLQPLYRGISAFLMSPQSFMERPERWLRAISNFGGTVSGAPDFAYRLCAARVELASCAGLDLRRWRLAFCGAEPVRAETLRAFADRFAALGFNRFALYPCYGLAEATLLVTGGDHGSGVLERDFDPHALARGVATGVERGRALVSCGRPQPGHDVLIADPETGKTLDGERIGEIQVTGPSVSLGYWGNGEATREAFIERGGRVFLRTGDLGFEHDGQVFITGRQKDLIIIRGQNIYPQDIELTVEQRLDFVRKGRSVAFAVEGGTEAIGVAVELSQQAQKVLDPSAVCQAVCECVAAAHGESPSVVLLVNSGGIPLTSSGKLQRQACKKAWQRGTLDAFFSYDITSGAAARAPAPQIADAGRA